MIDVKYIFMVAFGFFRSAEGSVLYQLGSDHLGIIKLSYLCNGSPINFLLAIHFVFCNTAILPGSEDRTALLLLR